MNFGGSLDLVTITSVIIFFSAIIMSLTLNYSTAVQKDYPLFVSSRIKIMASYIKKVFDSLDTENTYTTNFRRHMNIIGGFIIAFFVMLNLIVGFRDILTLLPKSMFITLAYYAVGAGILFFIGRLTFKEITRAHGSLAIILANQSFTRNIARSKRIIKAAALSLALIVIGLFSPLVIFLLDLPKVWGLASIVIVAIGIFIIRDSITHINSSLRDNAYPQYQKLSPINYRSYSTKVSSGKKV
jgi:small-conductance mechanosensitive channel